MKYSIVIPTYNHCDDLLKPCVESILKYSTIEDIELVISANGCTDNTKQYLEELKEHFIKNNLKDNFKYFWHDSPLGYPKATNEGIKLTTCDKVVLLNNDCILLDQSKDLWLNILHDPFTKNVNCGISCVVKEYSNVVVRNFAIFFCVMIDRKVFDKIGLLNEEYGVGSCEDIEFCILAEENGFTIDECIPKLPTTKSFHTGQYPIYHLAEGTVHDQSLVQNWSSNFLKNSFRVALKHNPYWKKNIMRENTIAVITPIYNDISHIFRCINSVKIQSYKNVTHYIYDDNSTDNLQEAISFLVENDDTIKYYRGDQNKGQSYGRNFLIEQAIKDGCQYIAFLDSDDSWIENHLETSLIYLNQYDIVYTKPTVIDEKFSKMDIVNIPVPKEFIGKQLLYRNFIWMSSVVAKKECFVENKFDSDLDSVEDWDMWIRLWKSNYKFVDKKIQTIFYLHRNTSQASIGKSKMPLLKNKHEMLDSLKLHLACGHDYTEGYINIDLYAPDDAVCDARFDVQKLPYDDNSVDEIKAFHIIEHFHFFEIKDVLEEWFRVLKPGGRLWLETPDFLETCRSFVEGSPVMNIEDWRVLLYGHFFAHPWVPGQTHKFLFTEQQLRTNLGWAGFKNITRKDPASKYVMPHTVHLFLNVEAFK
jgi:glycosyltransferase involved in cell wall biosynthesis